MSKVVNSVEFKEEIKNGVVVVDFFADWCGPCKMLAPIFEELGSEMSNVSFVKIDVDKSPDIAMSYKVASIPTVIVFKDGEKVAGNVGFMPKEQIKQMVEAHV